LSIPLTGDTILKKKTDTPMGWYDSVSYFFSKASLPVHRLFFFSLSF
jgi:hypothetical protein